MPAGMEDVNVVKEPKHAKILEALSQLRIATRGIPKLIDKIELGQISAGEVPDKNLEKPVEDTLSSVLDKTPTEILKAADEVTKGLVKIRSLLF